jgi:hypothetical protein
VWTRAPRIFAAVAVVALSVGCVAIPQMATGAPDPTAIVIPTRGPAKPSRTPRPAGATSTSPAASPTRKSDATPELTPALTANPSDPACSDDAFKLEGFRWEQPIHWYFNVNTLPDRYDRDEVLEILKRGWDNITTARNDCGRPDNVSATSIYRGFTPALPCENNVGDGISVVGFGKIPRDMSKDTIAATCPYTFSTTGNPAEVDIVISDEIGWAMSKEGCFFDELLEPTITHEVGHAFGLDHVSEEDHPSLTMSTTSNGPCQNEESTLGLGDLLGLEELYGK